jgi:hypothetical protein
MINRLRTMLAGDRPELYAILDIGTVEAKALLVLIEGEKATLVGAGRQVHQPGAIANSSIADARLAATGCEAALAQAEAQTETVVGEKLVADRVVVGISGPMLSSTCLSMTVRRPRPQDKLNEAELRSVIERAERLLLQTARETVAHDVTASDKEVGVVDADILHVHVDGVPLTSTMPPSGTQIDVRMSNIWVPARYLALVQSLLATLELEPVAILAGCSAITHTHPIATRGDGLIIDVGGECTDLTLVRQGGVEDVQTLLTGGMSFTRRIARTLGVPMSAAEDIKKDYSSGRLGQERAAEIQSALLPDVHAWLEGVQALLEAMARSEDLPAHMYLAGGAIALPDLDRAVRQHPWLRVLSFVRSPQVTLLQAKSAGLVDSTRHPGGPGHVGPVALAAWAVQSTQRQSAIMPQRILQQVVHGMGLS